MKLNCLIVDDEPSSQSILKIFCEDVDFLNVIKICNNALEAMSILNSQNDIDLLFLDINMPKLSGLNFYKSLLNPPDVIFTTAYSEFALDGFEVNAIDYLLKPFSFERFLAAANKALNKKKSENNSDDTIIIKANKVLHQVHPDDILFVEAFGDYVKVHQKNTVITTNSTFTNILKILPKQFVRCHKSFAINLKKMNSLAGNVITIGDKTVPIGQTYKSDFLKSLN
ncbi:LytTR family DNA-binding domain-containing protein [Flavobacteriaceae bacterium S0825]|uniref:LytR/AlgR family response regulator transcription factor n=1 Tax=Gaetbulibacter sp. S0825 TaxID=2720084 RepID=UPI00142FEEF2|nr:LytTR family DNA-binding domain-containing protein [Gaetbulibacter sp. S0825]MCK0110032.1 LytTR family DNA-binding domain-containing protein [Flavobacteriaceae bacterium S0825]NIX65661.1 response regulator transcription factor [Gaetbulibacter sp. S0825]